MTDPERVLVVGDTHGNTRWMPHVIDFAAEKEVDLILQLGDFGFDDDDGGRYFLEVIQLGLEAKNLHLQAIDGNHENHDYLRMIRLQGLPAAAEVPGYDRITYLPRGTRWRWHERTWLALGGAVSVDQGLRIENGWQWFPEEVINGDDLAAVTRGRKNTAMGPADVMITHDCPSAVHLTLPPPPRFWLPYIAKAEQHRALLQQVVDIEQPSHLMHGHYHMLYGKAVSMPYGTCQVTGLGCDGSDDNFRVLNVKTMEWETE